LLHCWSRPDRWNCHPASSMRGRHASLLISNAHIEESRSSPWPQVTAFFPQSPALAPARQTKCDSGPSPLSDCPWLLRLFQPTAQFHVRTRSSSILEDVHRQKIARGTQPFDQHVLPEHSVNFNAKSALRLGTPIYRREKARPPIASPESRWRDSIDIEVVSPSPLSGSLN